MAPKFALFTKGSVAPKQGFQKYVLSYHSLALNPRTAFLVCLFVLRFYDPVNPMGSCRAWSVYLTTRLLGRLGPLSGIVHILSPETDNCPS